ncbi:hypothetical protein N7U66_06460 [Lacinutrix neustonica]|uniref:Uncharacterized protein n=1 Tax=Lacinutrix neustonica TaxID=2980107 RepID=A0A9E8MX00_9FLAO|nr:hypothetical protein [Lacinutrix neustonica]WAC03217.1 hypothetical protein N7U66_06460 [Lacinutrix neustonica]
MNNLILTTLFLTIGLTMHSQNETSVLQAKTASNVRPDIQNQTITSLLTLKWYHLNCDFKVIKNKKVATEKSSTDRFTHQTKDFFIKFYGGIAIRLT